MKPQLFIYDSAHVILHESANNYTETQTLREKSRTCDVTCWFIISWSHLNANIHMPHQNIYIFVQTFLRQQTAICMSIGSLVLTRSIPRAVKEKSSATSTSYRIQTRDCNSETIYKASCKLCNITKLNACFSTALKCNLRI
jgi:hypothetical protein